MIKKIVKSILKQCLLMLILPFDRKLVYPEHRQKWWEETWPDK